MPATTKPASCDWPGLAIGRTTALSDGSGQAAMLQGAGPFTLALDWGTPLAVHPGRASFTLPVPPAGAVRATLDIPGDEAEVRLSAGLITRRSVTNGRTVIEATLQPGTATEVSWTLRDSASVAAQRESRTMADLLSLITISDQDTRLATIVDLTVLQGEPERVTMTMPAGYQLASVTGPTVRTSDTVDGAIDVAFTDPSARRHQFLVVLERPHDAGSFGFDTGFVSVEGTQRERADVAVQGVGTLELEATEGEGVHRIDVRELNDALQSMARTPLLAAFRYQRTSTTPASHITFNVKRFADAAVLAAGADSAAATTMVTAEGRALTEMMLRVRNRAQPFLKVDLPEGATLVSASLDGVAVKPVLGADGTRVPLLRAGLRPNGVYSVSFVFMYAGTPFEKKGDLKMLLPKVDLPIGVLTWELFVPDRYSVKVIDGNVIESITVDRATDRKSARQLARASAAAVTGGVVGGAGGGIYAPAPAVLPAAGPPGQLRGRIVDPTGSVLPGVTVQVSVDGWARSTYTDPNGRFMFEGVPAGRAKIQASLEGFTSVGASFLNDGQPKQWDPVLTVGSLEETITVAAATPDSRQEPPRFQPPSNDVLRLQQRTAGVLPIPIEVPRAGTSYQFVKPLVIGQETSVTLRYKRR